VFDLTHFFFWVLAFFYEKRYFSGKSAQGKMHILGLVNPKGSPFRFS
jgi:hypothetical protein